MNIREQIGAAVARARERSGLRKSELADAAGISRPTITKLERGQTLPDVITLRAIANVLEVTVDSLLGPPPRKRTRRSAA